MPKQRDQLPFTALWNVESYYKDSAAWRQDFDRLSQMTPQSQWSQITAHKGMLSCIEDAKYLCDHYFDLECQIGKLLTYAHMRRDENTLSEKNQIRFAKAEDLFQKFKLAFSWIEPEFIALGDRLDILIESDFLKSHRFYLKKLKRRQAHTLSPDQEALLSRAQKALATSHLAFGALNDTDLKFPPAIDAQGAEHDLTHSRYALYLRKKDRALRQSAFENLHGSYRDHRHVIAQLLEGNCQAHIFEARARGFKSSLHAALFEHNISVSLYQNLIGEVKNRSAVMQRYMTLRKKILGIDDLNVWDMQVPLIDEVKDHYTFEEACELVIASSAPLGDEYVEALRSGLLCDRWVDRFETEYKRSGAYSSGCWGQLPLIMLNYQNTLQDVFTLAHEIGHSMHSYLSWKNQPYQTSNYSIFAAEVASTFSEELLLSHLLKSASNRRLKARLIYQKIEDIRATLFRQTLFAEFEWRIHQICEKGDPLTASSLNTLYHSLAREYCNDGCLFSSLSCVEWARIPHFYYNFYVFQYATGISAALQLSGQFSGKDQNIAQKAYLNFLRSGGSDYPVEQLRRAGVDMTTSAPIVAALDRFEELVKELEYLLDLKD